MTAAGPSLFGTRRSGVLLHLTSLPGPHGCGDLGADAYHFADWLKTAGQTLWQVLPLNVVDYAGCPYASESAFAHEPLLLSLDDLAGQHAMLDIEDAEPIAQHLFVLGVSGARPPRRAVATICGR